MTTTTENQSFLALTYEAREDGFEVSYQDKPIVVLRMREALHAGQHPHGEPDIASVEAADGEWLVQGKEADKALQIFDVRSNREKGNFEWKRDMAAAEGRLRLDEVRTYGWQHSPSGDAVLVDDTNERMIELAGANRSRGEIRAARDAASSDPAFPLLVALALYLYMSPVASPLAAAHP